MQNLVHQPQPAPRHLPFDQLNPCNAARALARFVDARAGDGYLYELDRDGALLCRHRAAAPIAAD